jgi:large subunit ribosomal protein L24
MKMYNKYKLKIKKGDKVLVIAGRDRGKKGKVEKIIKDKQKVVVAGVNILKKHTKPSAKNRQGGIIEFAAPLAISNVILLCPKCNKPSKINYKFLKNNQKIRVCKKCNEAI